MALVFLAPIESSTRRTSDPVGSGNHPATARECLNVELICALLARAAKGTVRLTVNREETFITHRGRPETDVKMKIGMKKDGRITGVDFTCIQRGGAYSVYGIVSILYAGGLIFGMYDF